ncbi:NADP-dependent oxidoreductase domain-containing protein [Trametes elegans]|nr:NADP-dependent oxidoreductase domain-containing protein [Trametes elegans]
MRATKTFGVGTILWSPLARGTLPRPPNTDSKRAESDPVEELAESKGVSMAQISIAWVLSKDGVSAPTVGSTKLENLQDIISALQVKLTPDDSYYLQEPYQPPRMTGHF